MTVHSEIGPPIRFSFWPGLVAAALQVPGDTLARFLTHSLELTTRNDPGTCAAIWWSDAPSLVDIEHATVLAGETSWQHFISYAIADPAGDPAATVARQLVQHLADYAVCAWLLEHAKTLQGVASERGFTLDDEDKKHATSATTAS